MMLSTTKTQYQKGVVPMNSITSEAHFRQRVLKFSFKHGVTEASRRFHVSRNAIYEWKAKYDGSWKSLIIDNSTTIYGCERCYLP